MDGGLWLSVSPLSTSPLSFREVISLYPLPRISGRLRPRFCALAVKIRRLSGSGRLLALSPLIASVLPDLEANAEQQAEDRAGDGYGDAGDAARGKTRTGGRF